MHARSALPLLSALALGVTLPLAASAQAAATDDPAPSCQDVIELATSHRPGAALVAAAQVEATGEAACEATVLAEAEGSVAEAAVLLRRAQGLDAEAGRVGADTEAAAELRRAADTAYAQALALDLGLTAAFDGLTSDPGSEAPPAGTAVVAARLVDLGHRAEARELLVTAVKEGKVDPEELDQALQDLLAPSPPDTVVDWWDEDGKTWLTVGAWCVAGLALIYLVLWTGVRRPPYRLDPATQAVTAGKADGVAQAWADLLPRRLDDLAESSPAMRISTGPDTDLTLPDIDGMPSGFKAVVEFWTWFRRLRVRHVSALLHDEGGKVGVTVSIRKRSGRLLETRTLRPLDDTAPVERATYLGLLPQAAVWIAFQTTVKRHRVAVLGTRSEVAVLCFADSTALLAAGDKGAGRRALLRARAADPGMLAARLNLAFLDLRREGNAPALPPSDWQARLEALHGVERAASARLTDLLGDAPHIRPTTRDYWWREVVRCRATVMRARYNRAISVLNWSVVDDSDEIRQHLGAALDSTRKAAAELRETTPRRSRWGGIRRTALKVQRHAELMRRGHLDPGPTTFLSDVRQQVTTIDPDWDAAYPDALPGWVDYGIACVAATVVPLDVDVEAPARLAAVARVQSWLDRAFAKQPGHYVSAARRDPFFASLVTVPPEPASAEPRPAPPEGACDET